MSNYQILLIDDDPLIHKSVGTSLKKKGYQVTNILKGSDAIKILGDRYFDLVITDLVIDEIDGIKILKKVRELGFDTMVMILTGHGNLSSAIDAIRLDADDYILKPCESEELFFRVNRSFENLELKRKLQIYIDEMEQKVDERTHELKEKTKSLEEANTALKVLLKKGGEERVELETKLLFDIKKLVLPFLAKLRRTRLNEQQTNYLEMVDFNLNNIISPFEKSLSSTIDTLTPTEIQVANLVKQGKSIKESAEILNLSQKTIESHRKSIRKKVGIQNKKINLRSHLLSMG